MSSLTQGPCLPLLPLHSPMLLSHSERQLQEPSKGHFCELCSFLPTECRLCHCCLEDFLLGPLLSTNFPCGSVVPASQRPVNDDALPAGHGVLGNMNAMEASSCCIQHSTSSALHLYMYLMLPSMRHAPTYPYIQRTSYTAISTHLYYTYLWPMAHTCTHPYNIPQS